ncbi:MAG: hypothetical protein U0736_04830 [Gemmataceae bacterium]
MIAEVKRLVGGWKKAPLPPLDLPKVGLPAKFTQEILSMPDAAQLHVNNLGHASASAATTRTLQAAGDGPRPRHRAGFHRTGCPAGLRDREGLAYTVSATITTTAGLQPGVFSC